MEKGYHNSNNSSSSWFIAFIVAGATIYFYWRKRRVNRGGTSDARGNITSEGSQGTDFLSKATKSLSLQEILLSKKYGGWKTAVDFRILLDTKAHKRGEYALSCEGKKFLEQLLNLKCCVYLYCRVPRDGYKELKKKTSCLPPGEDRESVVTTPVMKEVLSFLKPFSSLGLKREQVLFCSSAKALESFSRQIEPTLLLTAETDHMKLLANHLPYIVCVGGNEMKEVSANVIMVPEVNNLL
eukprot:Tbor_TRINITY_DN3764_c0_g1::TRINITY_DN3764_c0_g1_i1::g.2505::m.2505